VKTSLSSQWLPPPIYGTGRWGPTSRAWAGRPRSGRESRPKWPLGHLGGRSIPTVVLLWCWSSACNKVNQGERRASTDEICCSVTYHLNEMQKLKPPAKGRTIVQTEKWKTPRERVYKVNCDGAFF
jgi:hypothetical protein